MSTGHRPANLNLRQGISTTDASSGGALGDGDPMYSAILFVRITGGGVADGWDCVKVGQDNQATDKTWTRIRTKPASATLTIGSDYPAVINEISGRPVILVRSVQSSGCACGRISGIPAPQLISVLPDDSVFTAFGPYGGYNTWITGTSHINTTNYETAVGRMLTTGCLGGVRRKDIGGLSPGSAQIIHDFYTAACWPGLPNSPTGQENPSVVKDNGAGVLVGYSHLYDLNELDVTSGSAHGWDWGTPFMFWTTWHPRIGHALYARAGTEVTFTIRERTADPSRDFTQVPFGGQTFVDHTPREQVEGSSGLYADVLDVLGNPITAPWEHYMTAPEYPVWLMSSYVQPVSYPLTVRALNSVLRNDMDANEFNDWRVPIFARHSVWWHDPTHAHNYNPHVFWSNWADIAATVYPTEVVKNWMGCGNYNKWLPEPGTFCTNLEGVWAPAAGFSAKEIANRVVRPGFGTIGFGSTHSDETPGIKIDGGYQGPKATFTKPARLAELVETHGGENVTINSSTAEVRMTGVQRTEFKIEVKHREVVSVFGQLGFQYNAGSVYGPLLSQKSNESAGETYKTIFKNRWQQGTSSSTRNGSDESDNTHVGVAAWKSYVNGETGTTPAGDSGLPFVVPRLPPFYASGDTNAPETIIPLEGAKLAHFLVGKQYDGLYSGEGAEDTTCKPTLAMFSEYRAWGYEYDEIPSAIREPLDDVQDDTGTYWPTLPPNYDFPWCLVPAHDASLEWVRTQADYTIEGLENIKYRHLGWSPIDPPGEGEEIDYDAQVVPDGVWTSVDMVAVATALKNDTAATKEQTWSVEGSDTFDMEHFEYEIRPGFPWTHSTGDSSFDGIQTNLNAWCSSFMPREIVIGEDGESLADDWTLRIEDIVFQEFTNWEIRSWTMNVTSPEGTEDIEVAFN